jgi:hypothetical protein
MYDAGSQSSVPRVWDRRFNPMTVPTTFSPSGSKLVVDCTDTFSHIAGKRSLPSARDWDVYGALVEVDESNSPDLSRHRPLPRKLFINCLIITDHSIRYALIISAGIAAITRIVMPLGGKSESFYGAARKTHKDTTTSCSTEPG